MTSKPSLMASIVTELMTLLMPGAGPPPTNSANRPLAPIAVIVAPGIQAQLHAIRPRCVHSICIAFGSASGCRSAQFANDAGGFRNGPADFPGPRGKHVRQPAIEMGHLLLQLGDLPWQLEL